jgi:hypothetical protein
MALFLWGCAGSLSRQWLRPSSDTPAQVVIPTIPFFPQTDFQCGPASLAMTLVWSGVSTNPDQLTPIVYTPSIKGSLQPAMIAATRRQARLAYVISSPQELLQEVAAGHPVIVLQNLGLSWAPIWHYSVVIGYDLDTHRVVLHSGETRRKTTKLRVFNNTWSRSGYWGLLTLPPGRLPATATETPYLQAVLGLEKAAQWPQAVLGYQVATQKWPESLAAHMGVGNAYYAMGDLQAAEGAFNLAVAEFPNEGVAYNNLAQVLYEQGKIKAALTAAEQAVRLGGPHIDSFQETFREIERLSK